MKCLRCGNEMTNTLGGNWHCETCGFAIDDLVDRSQFKVTIEPRATKGEWTDNDSIQIDKTSTPSGGFIDTNHGSIRAFVNYPVGGGALQGWICPKCGAGVSPYTNVCPNCTLPQKIEFTC